MKIPLAAIAFITMGSACFANEPLAQSKDGQVIVENLPSSVEREFEGCGCHFYSPGNSSKMAIAWDYSQRESMTAAIQVNGQTERLPLVDETSKRKRGPNSEPRKGDITRYKFSSGSVSSILSCKVSETCWGTPGCEHIGYSCSAQVEVGNARVKFPLEGGCGC
jgi:hypothetical protein